MTDKPKVDLGLLEEDDEFEEFPAEGKISIPSQCIFITETISNTVKHCRSRMAILGCEVKLKIVLNLRQ
jgi:hypothetical protein